MEEVEEEMEEEVEEVERVACDSRDLLVAAPGVISFSSPLFPGDEERPVIGATGKAFPMIQLYLVQINQIGTT